MMKYLPLLCLPFLFPSISVAESTTCSDAKELYEGIKDSYDKTIVTRTVQILKMSVKACGQTTQQLLGVDDKFLDGMTKESRKREFLRVKDDLDTSAKYGNTTQFEKEFADYSKEFGFADYKNYLAEKKQQGLAAEAKERKVCTSVDMSKDMPPARNQDSVGWCYAFTAADLMSYKLKKNISAVDIALAYQDDWISGMDRGILGTAAPDIRGGFTDKALQMASKNGFCLESELPSEDNQGGNFAANLKELDIYGRNQILSQNLACNDLYTEAKKMFPKINLTDVQDVVNKTVEEDFILGLRNKTCKNRIQAKPEVVIVQRKGFFNGLKDTVDSAVSEEKYAQIIDEQLSANNPLSLGIDSHAIYDRRAPASTPSSASFHAVTLVGRRFNEKTGQCEYKIKNSWGKGCSSPDKSYNCSQGQFWMSKPDLFRRTWDVTYVK
ncbi:C1 family peptidase [Bdellovibrio sp. ZAP7]|uniref:C1 family peptidase n=1 Tax=Bdellovibrio sp. ZAP7 TaxID=2231053 RepID=UPI0011584766|nr:C1 family peptidase [Bdellovibrio sp. ZAP7]